VPATTSHRIVAGTAIQSTSRYLPFVKSTLGNKPTPDQSTNLTLRDSCQQDRAGTAMLCGMGGIGVVRR
jgi:hypothetical protein